MAIDGTCEDVAETRPMLRTLDGSTMAPTRVRFRNCALCICRSCGTHAIFDAVAAPCCVAEARLALVLLHSIEADMVLLDRGLFAGPLIENIRDKQAQVIAGLESHVLTKPVTRLRDGIYLASLSPQSSHGLRKPLLVRVITYRVYAPDLPYHGELRRMATTLLDPKQAPDKEVTTFYHERWEIEIVQSVKLSKGVTSPACLQNRA